MVEMSVEAINRIVKLGQAEGGVETTELYNGKQGVLVPEGYALQEIEPIEKPLMYSIHQTVAFDTDDSLIHYVNEFKGASTHMFVSATGNLNTGSPAVCVIIDYHHPPASVFRLVHRAFYRMPWSAQWKRWSGLAKSDGVTQAKFLEFLEENSEDVTMPNPADLMAIVGSLSNRKKVDFKSGFRLSDSSIELSYVEENEASGGAKAAVMPSEMTIGIPVFVDGPAYEVRVFLRYRINEGKLTFQIVLHRAEFMVEDAMKIAVAKIEQATALKALWGSVER